MKGDFTRSTFRSKKHYKSVRMQQGRVQLDADWNEQADILLHRIEMGTRDLLGQSGGTNESDGFRIVPDPDWIDDFHISAGRYYVNGVLCENDNVATLREQPDRRLDGTGDRDVLGQSGFYLVYLDVWTRNITHLEDHELRELALGGADTTTRAKTIWQVRCEPLAIDESLAPIIPPSGTLPPDPSRIRKSTGKLTVRITNAQLVNQLYRIEIDKSGGQANARFKWSRDNGAVVGLVNLKDQELAGKNLPMAVIDRRFQKGDWVEIISEKDELEGQPDGVSVEDRFFRIVEEPGKTVVLDHDHGLDGLDGSSDVIKIRRWDRNPQSATNEEAPLFALQSTTDGWIELENGIQVKFTPDDYKSGDYWYVPVRVGSEITVGEPPSVPPDGVSHDIAHLAVVHVNDTERSLRIERDLRRRYIVPGDDRGLMYAGGDGQVTPRGTVLPEPLAVYVNGHVGRAGVVVRFSLPEGAMGTLYGSDPNVFPNVGIGTFLDVATDGDGMARCWWMPMDTDRNGVVPPVTATLFEGNDTEAGNSIQFNAWLSNADRVVYKTRHNLGVGTVETGLHDLYDQVTKLHHVSGDGQVASRGEFLPQPLVVELTGHTPAAGHRVRFTLPTTGSDGDLFTDGPSVPSQTPRKELEVTTDAAGRALCYWRMPALRATEHVPPVTATLLGANNAPTGHAVTFNAWLSDADRVRYYLSLRAQDALPAQGTQASLQQILDNVYQNLAILHYVGGDSQSGRPLQPLHHPLQVRVGNGAWSAGSAEAPAEPRVRFRIVSDAGGRLSVDEGELATELDGEHIGNGIYQCTWILGDAPGPREVEAFVYFDDNRTAVITPLRFTAHVLASTDVRYDNPHNGDVRTVDDALDDLYEQVTKLHHVSGDGQVASRGEFLPQPLVIELTGYTPAAGHRVRFALPTMGSDGDLFTSGPSVPSQTPSKELDVTTDGAGRAVCYWRMPALRSTEHVPPVTATLLGASNAPTGHSVTFNAWLSDADKVRYYLSQRAQDALPAQGAQANLQQILDNLYQNLAILHYVGGDSQSGRPRQPLYHPLQVRLGNGAWAAGSADVPAEPRVRFRIISDAGGTLSTGQGAPATELDGVHIGNGIYQCTWTLGDAPGPREVEAFVYFDGNLSPAVTPLRFTAHVLASTEVRYDNPHNGNVRTVDDALDDLYNQVTSFHLVSGDGQVASRGEFLPLPLVVELSGYTPATAWGVRFDLNGTPPIGGLHRDEDGEPTGEPLTTLELDLDAAGRSSCHWLMPPTGSTVGPDDMPWVTATLLGPDGADTDHVVSFHAWLSDADQVRYYLSDRAQDANPTFGEQADLQRMLDNVYDDLASLHQNAATLYYVGGDGQSGLPGQPLPHPLRVRLGSGAWAAGVPRVQFRIAPGATGNLRVGDGEGEVEPVTVVDGELVNGVYQCTWILGPAAGPHAVEAVVSFDGNPVPLVVPVRFTAHVLAATEVLYETTEHNGSVRSVEQALDDLYAQVTSFHLVSGDGQVASRGEILALPLVVELTGYTPATAWGVRFDLNGTPPIGGLHRDEDGDSAGEPVTTLDLDLDAAGRASCHWLMPPTGSTVGPDDMPWVTATLLGPDGEETDHVVTFHAWLSDADQVAYSTQHNASVQTVEASLDDLYEKIDDLGGRNDDLVERIEQVTRLHLVSGDGQIASRGQDLPLPLIVEFTGLIPETGRKVLFALPAADSDGELYATDPSLDPDNPPDSHKSVEITTDAVGRARCYWRMPALSSTTTVPPVTASLVGADTDPIEHPVIFHAWLSDADQVAYSTQHNASVQTIKASLDDLYDKTGILDERANVLDERVDALDERANVLDERTNALDARANALDARANALDEQLEQVTRLHLVSGDGQVASRGQALPLPLVVEFTGLIPETGRKVLFALPAADSDSELYATDPSLDPDNPPDPHKSVEITTDDVGRARCYWRMPALASTTTVPPVTASLVGADTDPVEHPITFHAWLSDADQVGYATQHNANVQTVKASLDDLYEKTDALDERTNTLDARTNTLDARTNTLDARANALDEQLEQVTRLHLVSGNGQVASRGQDLPLPLVVEFTGLIPGTGRTVRFALPAADSDGDLFETDPALDPENPPVAQKSVEVATDDVGRARCYWRMPALASTTTVPPVTASLVGADTDPVEHPVTFHAWLSEASEISYEDPLEGSVRHVEQALRTLYANQRVLEVESGNAQAGLAQQPLARPLQVRVARGQWSSTAGATRVQFSAAGGGRLGAAQSGPFDAAPLTVNQVPGQDGLYECWWELGPNGAQEVQAQVELPGVPNQAIAPVMFHAHLREAAELHYANSGATTATTVKQALDDLFSMPLPVGAMVDYASRSTPTQETVPRGFLLCGQRVSRTAYAALYTVIGDSFGAPDSSTFALPPASTGTPNVYKLIKH